MFDKVIHQQP